MAGASAHSCATLHAPPIASAGRVRYDPVHNRMTKAKRARAKRRSARPRGPRGRTGHTGAPGPAGPPGKDHASEIAALTLQVSELVSGLQIQAQRTETLSAQVSELVKELQIQLVRIGQLQAQLDRLTTGHSEPPPSRRMTDRTEH